MKQEKVKELIQAAFNESEKDDKGFIVRESVKAKFLRLVKEFLDSSNKPTERREVTV